MKVATRARPSRPKKRTLADLEHEVMLLRSAVIGLLGEDEEGQYRPEFVEEILKSSKEKPTHTYKGPGSFLKQLREI